MSRGSISGWIGIIDGGGRKKTGHFHITFSGLSPSRTKIICPANSGPTGSSPRTMSKNTRMSSIVLSRWILYAQVTALITTGCKNRGSVSSASPAPHQCHPCTAPQTIPQSRTEIFLCSTRALGAHFLPQARSLASDISHVVYVIGY